MAVDQQEEEQRAMDAQEYRRLGFRAGVAGPWHILVPPLRTRRIDLRILKEVAPAAPEWQLRPKLLEVEPFSFTEPPEGDFSEAPAVIGNATEWRPGSADPVYSFLQACADLAADLGIRPTNTVDRTDELAATRAHLDDMRRLVGLGEKPLLLEHTFGPR